MTAPTWTWTADGKLDLALEGGAKTAHVLQPLKPEEADQLAAMQDEAREVCEVLAKAWRTLESGGADYTGAAARIRTLRQEIFGATQAAIAAAMLSVDRLSPDGVSKLFAPDHAGALLRLGFECSARLRTMKGGG